MVLCVTRLAAHDNPGQRFHALTLKQAAAKIEKCRADKQIVSQLDMKIVRRVIRFDLTISPNVEESHWLIHLNLPKTTFDKKSRQYESFGFEVTTRIQCVWGENGTFRVCGYTDPKPHNLWSCRMHDCRCQKKPSSSLWTTIRS